MKQRNIVRQIVFYVVAIVLIVAMISLLNTRGSSQDPLTYDDVLRYFQNEQVREVTISPKNIVTMKVLENGSEKIVSYKLRDYSQFYYDLGELINQQVEAGIITTYEPQPATEIPMWLSFLPMILIIGGMIVLWVISANSMGGKNGKFRHHKGQSFQSGHGRGKGRRQQKADYRRERPYSYAPPYSQQAAAHQYRQIHGQISHPALAARRQVHKLRQSNRQRDYQRRNQRFYRYFNGQ